MHSVLTSLLLLSSILYISRRLLRILRGRLPLPPGPPGLPMIGNVWDDIPHEGEPRWRRYYKWSRQYDSDVIYVEVFGDSLVILNSEKAVMELLEKRASNYSDRPTMHMADELSGLGWDIAHMRYSDWWRMHRRTFHQSLHSRVLADYYTLQSSATMTLLQNLANSPEEYYRLVRHHSSSIVLKLAYGYTLERENDPYIQLAVQALEGIKETVNHGSFLVDHLPILKYVPEWFPGASFKRKARLWSRYAGDLKELPWEWLQEDITRGTAIPSFATRNLEKLSLSPDDQSVMQEVVKNCTAMIHLAGSDTTLSVILTFILAMTLHPDIQARAQAEIDVIVGKDRLPEFSDRDRLPYVEAVLAECLRWHPPTPLAVPHRCLNDDVYGGYHIPAGATVVGNAWAVLNEENVYGANPTRFDPGRFMPKSDGHELPPHPVRFAFGFGRRICPARHFALNTVYITMTHILATFDISKALDEKGREIEPEIDYNDGAMSLPRPFDCRFVPRSPEALRLIKTSQ